MTKSKEELAKEYSSRFSPENGWGAEISNEAFLAGYDARQAEVDLLMSKLSNMSKYADQDLKIISDKNGEIQELKKNLDEQCRLNGIGASRELALMSQVNEQISQLLEFKKQALEVIGFYSREFNTNHEGAWIGGPLYKDKLHGNDMVNMSSFAVGGKRARSFLEKYGEK